LEFEMTAIIKFVSVLLIGSLLVCIAFLMVMLAEAVTLPDKPEITPTQMRSRIVAMYIEHARSCPDCSVVPRIGPLPPVTCPLKCSEKVFKQAMTVDGEWKCYGCNFTSQVLLWDYVGQSKRFYYWSTSSQCWKMNLLRKFGM
jgi:hypothetical protein